MFTDVDAIGADYKFVKEEKNIAMMPINPVIRMQAGLLAGSSGLFASFKTAVHFISSHIATVEVMAWYQVNSVGAINAPSKPK